MPEARRGQRRSRGVTAEQSAAYAGLAEKTRGVGAAPGGGGRAMGVVAILNAALRGVGMARVATCVGGCRGGLFCLKKTM